MGKRNMIVAYRYDRGRHSRPALYVFLMILFIVVGAPFLGMYLRYQATTLFKFLFNTIGDLCLIAGGITLSYAIIKIFLFGKISIESIIGGVIFLWIGAFLTGVPATFLGISITPPMPPTGYHSQGWIELLEIQKRGVFIIDG
jgi:hypothetical protein